MSEAMSGNYILRTRNPDDGFWAWHMDEPMSLKEANKLAQFNRIMGGIISQVWKEDEAIAAQEEQPRP